MFIESDPGVLTLDPVEEETDEALLLLERALGRIEKPHGWCKRSLTKFNYGTVNYCMLGAIQVEDSSNMRAGNSVTRALQYIVKATGIHSENSIPGWNDDRERRKHEVVAAFKKAIRLRKADLAREGDA